MEFPMEALLTELGRSELRRVRETIDSRTLRAALTHIIEVSNARSRLFIPHYWAVYYHDGRGSVHPRTAKKLVFFDDPGDDPRLRGGNRERYSGTRRLTEAEYRRGLRINQQRYEAGRDPYMYVVDSTGPATPKPFFDRLARGAARRAAPVVERHLDDHIQEIVDRERRLPGSSGRAAFRLD